MKGSQFSVGKQKGYLFYQKCLDLLPEPPHINFVECPSPLPPAHAYHKRTHFLNSWGPFLEGPDTFRARKATTKILNLKFTELFTSVQSLMAIHCFLFEIQINFYVVFREGPWCVLKASLMTYERIV